MCYWQKGKGTPCTKENINYKIECVKCEKEEVEEKGGEDVMRREDNNKTDAKEDRSKKSSLYLGETSREDRRALVDVCSQEAGM